MTSLPLPDIILQQVLEEQPELASYRRASGAVLQVMQCQIRVVGYQMKKGLTRPLMATWHLLMTSSQYSTD